MELVVGVCIGLAIWAFVSRSRNSEVAESALKALMDQRALSDTGWRNFLKMVQDTPDPSETARQVIDGKRDAMPRELDRHWTYMDDLTGRANRAADHYESIARKPAPGGATTVGTEVWQTIKAMAYRDPEDS